MSGLRTMPALIVSGVLALGVALLLAAELALVAADARTMALATAAVTLLAAGLSPMRRPLIPAVALIVSAGVLALLILDWLGRGITFETHPPVSYLLLLAVVVACVGMARYARYGGPLDALVVPAAFALLLLFTWEAVTGGYRIPIILLPGPSAIARAMSTYSYDLAQDFQQSVMRQAVPGFLLGSLAGISIAFAVDRSPFLQNGLLPFGNWVGVMPIVGIAPIMVMWFGFGAQSKIAVVVLMTFFPTLVTTLAGLRVSYALENDLMNSYSATYWQTLRKLRIPAAMPYIISALKLNASLALIGSIVAEFFGTPTYGLGFRIATEVGRLNLDRVWAAIVIAAITGSLAYGALSIAERAITFWHPSQRRGKS